MSESREKSFDEKFCSSCGEVIKKEAEICPKCGVRQPSSGFVDGPIPKDWLITLLLAIFLGIFGVHRFYVGKIGTGILMLLFGWMTLGIWLLIDIIMIACGKFKDANGKLILNQRG